MHEQRAPLYRRRMVISRRMGAIVLCGLAALAALVARAAPAEALIELHLASPPHAPEDAPDAIVHVPSTLRPGPLDLVVFLHGFSSCARALMAAEPTACTRGGAPQRAYGLAQIHARARTQTVLVVPQLAFLARDSHAPRFEQAGGFDAFVRDLRAQLGPHLPRDASLRSATLVAHSAGYRAAAAILRDTERSFAVPSVVLLDALYAQWDVFARFLRARDDHRLISLYTRDKATTRGNKRLAALLGAGASAREQEERPWLARLTQERVATPHGFVPQRHLEGVLRALFQNAP